MKKLSRKIYVGNIGENKITDTIDSLLEGRLNGDWTEYKKGDVAKYSFDFDDEYELELLEENNIKLNEVKEFINEGICYMVDEDIWYNIKFRNNIMVVDFEFIEL